ncbi:MAG: peptidoglycan-binding domain-containing protein [Betaproteobacteria bacterium]
MNTKQRWLSTCVVLSVMALGSGCSTDRMTRADKGTAAGATTGAVAGAVVGGPVGAVVGAGVGAYAGNAMAGGPVSGSDTSVTTSARYESTTVRSVQQALNDRGFGVGSVDGQWGPATEDAVRRFQTAAGLRVTGSADSQTLVALGVR